MLPETINTHKAVQLFQDTIKHNSRTRILCLVGDAKMGKSHLLTKVFPAIAEQDFQGRYAILDLRNPANTIPDILNTAAIQLKVSENYNKACEVRMNRPKVNLQNTISILSSHKISAKDSAEDIRERDRYFTSQFVAIAAKMDKVLLLFDSVDGASKRMKVWLMHTLLAQLSSLDQIRIVVAGRSIPDPNGSYAASCERYELRPVKEEEEYFAYCKSIRAQLVEQSIRDFAFAFDFKPGLFAEYVYGKFGGQELSND